MDFLLQYALWSLQNANKREELLKERRRDQSKGR